MAAIRPEHWPETLAELSCHDVVVNSVLQASGPHYANLSEQESLRLMVVLMAQRHQHVLAEAITQEFKRAPQPIVLPHKRDDQKVR